MLAAADLGLRSRGALKEARRHASWIKNPEAKKAYFEKLYAGRAAAIGSAAAEGKISGDEAERRRVLAETERDFLISESSAKQACLWYRTAAREFNSPLNPWASQAEKELPEALKAWTGELEASGIKPEPWMLE